MTYVPIVDCTSCLARVCMVCAGCDRVRVQSTVSSSAFACVCFVARYKAKQYALMLTPSAAKSHKHTHAHAYVLSRAHTLTGNHAKQKLIVSSSRLHGGGKGAERKENGSYLSCAKVRATFFRRHRRRLCFRCFLIQLDTLSNVSYVTSRDRYGKHLQKQYTHTYTQRSSHNTINKPHAHERSIGPFMWRTFFFSLRRSPSAVLHLCLLHPFMATISHIDTEDVYAYTCFI